MARIIIIGLGTSGFAAILAAKKTDRKAEVTVIDDKEYDLMHPCGLPYAVEGMIGDFEKLKHALHLDRMRVTHHHPFRVVSIDAEKQVVKAVRPGTGEEMEASYDKLVFSTGARPFVPPVPGLVESIGKGAFTVSSPEDAGALNDAAKPGMKAVCLGAGAIGLETAVALRQKGLKVTVVEMLGGVMPRALDPDMSALVRTHLEELGIRVICGQRLTEIKKDENGNIVAAVLENERISADLVVAAAGVRANVEIAKEAGAETGRAGIIINERMETNLPNVYAAGDCIQTVSIIDGKSFTLQLATTAYRQGTVAGINAAGGRALYPGVTGAFVSKIGELEVAAVGYTAEFAGQLGYKTQFGKIKDSTLYDWYPGGEALTVKVLAEEGTRRLLGAQAVGKSGAAARVNVASVAIKAGMTLDAIAEIEMAYCPAVSQAYDPFIKAIDLAARK